MLFHLVNVMWVGRLGASATAAVTTSFYVVWMIWSVNDLTAVAVAATVARHIGAREPERAAYGAAQATLLAVILGVLVSIVGLLLVDPVFGLLDAAPDVQALGVSYLRILLVAAPITLLFGLSESVLRAAGDTRTPMIVIASSLALNALLDPLLIFGWGPFPELGVRGAAIATVLAQLFAVGWFLVLALRRHPAFPFDFPALRRLALPYALALVRIGLPFSLMGLLFSAIYLGMAKIAARFGTASLAVMGVGNRVESIAYLVAVGLGLACEAVVGQNLGAREPKRAENAAWLAAGTMAGFAIVLSLAMWFVPEPLLLIFTSDDEVLRLGVPYLQVLAASQLFAVTEIVLNGAFSGAGDTLPPMVITGAVSTLRIPLAWWLCVDKGLGPLGIAWTITVTCIVRGALLAFWFRRGAWKTKALATARAAPAAHVAAAVALLSVFWVGESRADWQWFAGGRRFEPLLADPREPRLGFDYIEGGYWSGQAGGSATLAAIGAPTRVGLDGMAWLWISSLPDYNFPLETVDGTLGLWLETAQGPTSARIRLYHWSGHLADGAQDIEERRIVYSREILSAIVSQDVSPTLRLYGGPAAYLRADPNTQAFQFQVGGRMGDAGTGASEPTNAMERALAAAGVGAGGGMRSSFYAAFDLRMKAENAYRVNQSYEVGIRLGRGTGSGLRLAAGYQNGVSERGQAWQTPERYFSVGASFGD